MVRFEQVGGALVARIEGRLDNRTTPTIEQEIIAQLEGGARKIVFDFRGVTYVASVGLRLILLIAKRLKQAAGVYALYGLQQNVMEVFEISGFYSILVIKDSEDAALAAVKN